jgi:hypothetical protein
LKAARRQQLLLCLLPLALGVALSFKLPHLKPLIELEHALFWFPQKNDTLVEREPLKEFQVRVFDISPDDVSHDDSEKKAIRALSTSDDSSLSMQFEPTGPIMPLSPPFSPGKIRWNSNFVPSITK